MLYLKFLKEIVTARNRKRRPRLPAVSSTAIVNSDLNPRGSVLAGGELWAAETTGGNTVRTDTRVTIVGFRNHLLLVEQRS
ncbi:MAG TPA: NfeD family protein [Pyrinomonadaceae bacterium]|nr:NfeD family protein [Pyrinomonadaceae bacterium]